MFDSITAIPAYGRDYKSKAECLADWHAGKDFQCARTGQYLSVRDMEANKLTVWLRYKRMTQIVKGTPTPATKSGS